MRLLRLPDDEELKHALFPGDGKQPIINLQVHWKETAAGPDNDHGSSAAPQRKSDTLTITIDSFHFEKGPRDVDTRKIRGWHNGRRIVAGWIPSTNESHVEYEEIV